MASISWYLHRLRAMSAGEMALHARKKFRQFIDARRERDWSAVKLDGSGAFPRLPKAEEAPEVLREALRRDTEEILHGRWRAFGHLKIRVDDPPCWHKDYFVGIDLETNASAFKLNHRALPGGADVKLIWELSRWQQLVRLAMASHVLGDERAAGRCIMWLEDWVKHNPPYRGWNWTSALEAGMRLVQFTWIDALLSPNAERWGFDTKLDRLRHEILPPHVWFTWRHKSFGSSANNHLLGELAGLILATVRWPALAKWGAPLDELQRRLEHEVFAQFAEDGGNREQALNYQLFSFEFCWQARLALLAAGRAIPSSVEARLFSAASFFWNVQWNGARWPYGDSDDAYVTPLFAQETSLVKEWRDWFAGKPGVALSFWLGEFPRGEKAVGFGPPAHVIEIDNVWWYPKSGIAVAESGFWWLRWDVSPLGYLATAAHGHLDALHLSVWFKGVPFIIDPGTGAYYADKKLRAWLASRSAHNGPCPDGPPFPARLGPFLWAEHHRDPELEADLTGVLNLSGVQLRRQLLNSEAGLKWAADDSAVLPDGKAAHFSVRWQFTPGTCIKRISKHSFVLKRQDVEIGLEVSEDWAVVALVERQGDDVEQSLLASAGTDELERESVGVVSSAFRKAEWAPYLKLIARPEPGQYCVFRTTFLASATS